jgi:integrase
MPKRRINQLQTKPATQLDEVTTLSNKPITETAKPKPPKKRKTAPTFLQVEETDRLFRAIDSVRDRAIFRVAYHAGLRASEIGKLQMRDYNPKTDRLYVHRLKGSNSGEHPLCREESRVLKAWLKLRGAAPGPIFPSRKKGPISRKMLDVLMKQYGAAADLPAELRHFHVLKHSCATHLLSKGFHVEQVQDWIGHANIQNTMIYAKLTNSRRDEMAEKLKESW